MISSSPTSSSSSSSSSSSPSSSVYFSPPLIAMVVIIGTAIIFIAYSRIISLYFLHLRRRFRHWRCRLRLVRSYVPSSAGDTDSLPYSPANTSGIFNPCGLDDTAIKEIPLSIYTRKSNVHECAVCLLEFEENDYVRTLPACNHVFHVECIDTWLQSHANCPLCRTGILWPRSPFIPVMAARIRPRLDEVMLDSVILETLTEAPSEFESTVGEITQEPSPRRHQSEDNRHNRRDFLLKRSYSFGFERNLGREMLITEPATASPWRYWREGGFWSKRQSPFISLTKSTVLFPYRNRASGTLAAAVEQRQVVC